MVKQRTENRRRAVVVPTHPPACPRCGSTERSKKENVHWHEQGGEIDGRIYTRIKIYYATCNCCSQVMAVREYHNHSHSEETSEESNE